MLPFGDDPTRSRARSPLARASICAWFQHPHDNMPPVTLMSSVIALQGIFPSRN
jgi:microcystin-dependent protein